MIEEYVWNSYVYAVLCLSKSPTMNNYNLLNHNIKGMKLKPYNAKSFPFISSERKITLSLWEISYVKISKKKSNFLLLTLVYYRSLFFLQTVTHLRINALKKKKKTRKKISRKTDPLWISHSSEIIWNIVYHFISFLISPVIRIPWVYNSIEDSLQKDMDYKLFKINWNFYLSD